MPKWIIRKVLTGCEDVNIFEFCWDSLALFELRLQEFLKWIFAEDKEISKGIEGKYTLNISGHPSETGDECVL